MNCGNNFEENDQHIKKLAVAFGKQLKLVIVFETI